MSAVAGSAALAVAAREAWDEESSQQAYHYVLDDEKVQDRKSVV